jgi:hypothetical protein
MNVTMKVKDLHNANYKTLKRETEAGTRGVGRLPMFVDWQN